MPQLVTSEPTGMVNGALTSFGAFAQCEWSLCGNGVASVEACRCTWHTMLGQHCRPGLLGTVSPRRLQAVTARWHGELAFDALDFGVGRLVHGPDTSEAITSGSDRGWFSSSARSRTNLQCQCRFSRLSRPHRWRKDFELHVFHFDAPTCGRAAEPVGCRTCWRIAFLRGNSSSMLNQPREARYFGTCSMHKGSPALPEDWEERRLGGPTPEGLLGSFAMV